MIVLDTNVLSEIFRPVPSQTVLDWLAAQERLSVYITTITQAEILYGIELLPVGKRRTALAAAVDKVLTSDFQGRILSFDEEAARIFPRIIVRREVMGRPISQFDAMIAAVARTQSAWLATRDVVNFEHCDLRILNPWTA
jgi:predicted nucleic acid-binding protein